MFNEATSRYIQQHLHDDVRQLALRGCNDPAVDLSQALLQIQGHQTARVKLPSWAAVDGIIYPPRLSMEQCSSEHTARYKRELAERLVASGAISPAGSRLLDLTGGFGVDFAFLSEAFSEAVYVEHDSHLHDLACHNLSLLCSHPFQTFCADAATFLHTAADDAARSPFSLIFLDPARRDTHGARTYALGDCTPDVTELSDLLIRCAGHVLLKLSPMLDWRKAVADLAPHCVSEIHIVAVDGECKELLLLLTHGDGTCPQPRLFCVDIQSRDGSRTVFVPDTATPTDGEGAPPLAPHVKTFLYEPNATVMKAGCFHQLAAAFGIAQLAPNSHLFTSDVLVDGFPGRRFRVNASTTMNKRELRSRLGHLKRANVSVRNFPLTADELRRRLKLADGGNDYLFATTLYGGEHVILLCNKPAE